MRLLLKRFAEFGAEGTASWIIAGHWRCCALELPWRDNLRYISRIEPGLYRLIHVPDKDTHYLVGDGVVQLEEEAEESDRWGIRFDHGNAVADIRGCILVGLMHGFLGPDFAALSSRSAHAQLMEQLSWGGPNEILVSDELGGWAHG